MSATPPKASGDFGSPPKAKRFSDAPTKAIDNFRWPHLKRYLLRIKADNIYAVFHLFASEVPRFRIPGSRFRFRGFPPAIEVVTDRYKVPGSGSITQRGTLTGAKHTGERLREANEI